MYFEPAKKNHYRFPSQHSVQNFDLRFNFPEKSSSRGGENLHYKKTADKLSQNDTSGMQN